MKAAGVLFVSKNGNALFLKRSAAAPTCAGFWAFPAGGLEGDETPEEAARRECLEEIGIEPGELKLHTHQKIGLPPDVVGVGVVGVPPAALLPVSPPAVMPVVDFTTFICRVDEEFVPKLNDEHDGWAWAPITTPPEPLHPGGRIALERISMDELGVARAIADGRLSSPQRYMNVWLFAIRITGTDVAYRKRHNEYVYRNPDNYLNEEFLARCNGLTVIFVQRSGKSPDFHRKERC